MTLKLETPDTDETTDENYSDPTPLTPDAGGIDTVTLECGDESVILTGEQFDKATDAMLDAVDGTSSARKITAEQEAVLFRIRDELREDQSEEDRVAEMHKAAKKRKEATQDKLNRYIDELEHPDTPLLFKQSTDESAETSEAASPDDGKEVVASEVWRAVTPTELGIKEAICEKLADSNPPLATLGAIVDYITRGGRLIDVKGIGEAKATEIEDAMNRYWESHREESQPKDESWRATMLSEIGVVGEQVEALWNHAPPMQNLGEIADWLDRDGNTLSQIGALEEMTIKRILDAIDKARK